MICTQVSATLFHTDGCESGLTARVSNRRHQYDRVSFPKRFSPGGPKFTKVVPVYNKRVQQQLWAGQRRAEIGRKLLKSWCLDALD